MDDDRPRNDLPYREALHGVQAGVALELRQQNPTLGEGVIAALKSLRVGVDSAMVNDAALMRLLVRKGLFTDEEYGEEIRLEANRELDRYEDRLSAAHGARITLRGLR